jgi:hypothetical protein
LTHGWSGGSIEPIRERAGHPRGRSAEPASGSSTRLPAGDSAVAAAADLAGRIGNRALARLVNEPEENGHVQILELFHPTTLDGYRARIYVDRGAFIR